MSRLANYRPVPALQDRVSRRRTRAHAVHERNPAGSKLLRRVAKATLRLTARRLRLKGNFDAAAEILARVSSRKVSVDRAQVILARGY